MKKENWLIFTLMVLLVYSIFTCNGALAEEKVGSIKLFYDAGSGWLHGIVFDGQGNMFVGKEGKSILKITPDGKAKVFVKLADTTERTTIWDMVLGSDNNIYAAASDRILRITPNGKVSAIIKENFEGEWGACGLRFDENGNLYVVCANKVKKYTPELKGSIFIDGDNPDYAISALTGISFDTAYQKLYTADVYGKQLFCFPMSTEGKLGEPRIFEGLAYPEFMAIDQKDTAFLTLPGGNSVAKLNENGVQETYSLEGKLVEPNTIAFGKKGFKENAVYVTSGSKVFEIYVGTKETKE